MPDSSFNARYTFSAAGQDALIHEEGEVLKAYRDPVGIWTIGVGLTKASGVIVPKPGMVISRARSRELLQKAIEANYAPRVRRAVDLHQAVNPQSAFDGSVSFDFNTGRIHNATWVKLFNAGKDGRASLMQWVKARGRKLPGLVRRRKTEAAMIFEGRYPKTPSVTPSHHAQFVVNVDDWTKERVRADLARLGYMVGDNPSVIRIGAVRMFQADHDLTIDGLIGRATLSTLQRVFDARFKAMAAGGGAAAGGGTAVGGPVALQSLPLGPDGVALSSDLAAVTGVGVSLFAIGYLAYLAFSYRDVIAAKVADRSPAAARWLRSF